MELRDLPDIMDTNKELHKLMKDRFAKDSVILLPAEPDLKGNLLRCILAKFCKKEGYDVPQSLEEYLALRPTGGEFLCI